MVKLKSNFKRTHRDSATQSQGLGGAGDLGGQLGRLSPRRVPAGRGECSTRFEEEDSDLTEVEVDEVLGLVGHI